jgi:hypothetical protein
MQAIAGHRLNLAATDDVPGGRRHIPGANPEVQRLGLGPPRARLVDDLGAANDLFEAGSTLERSEADVDSGLLLE